MRGVEGRKRMDGKQTDKEQTDKEQTDNEQTDEKEIRDEEWKKAVHINRGGAWRDGSGRCSSYAHGEEG